MFSLRLLGGLTFLAEHGQPVGRAAQKRRLALLAVLATRPGLFITRDKLLALFWPESSNEEARHRLSAALYDLRQALGDEAFAGRGDELSIRSGAIGCDVVDFETAIERGDWLLATQLYRGPFLDGVHIEDAPEFDDWVEQRRAQLARSFSKALEEWARLCTVRANHAEAMDAWQRLADADPLNDRFALGLMKAFEAAGNRAGALRHAQQHEHRLRGDVGVEPDQSVRDYVAALRVAPVTPLIQRQPEEHTTIKATTPDVDASAPTVTGVPGAPLKKRARTRKIGAALLLSLLLPAALSVLPLQPEARSASAAGEGSLALSAVRQGETLLRTGRFESAAAAFERAVSLDSSLAIAHFQLAVATLWADHPGDKIDARIASALARSNRLDELHRMLLEGFVAWRRGEWHQAEAVYRRALTTQPTSANARHELGEVLFHYNAPQGRSLDEARVEFERVLDREPRHFGALWHLAQIAARDQRIDEVGRLTDRLLALDPDVVRTIEVEVLRAAMLDDDDELDQLIDRLRDADESLLFGVGWRLAVSGRDFEAAARVFNLLTDARRGPNAQGIGQEQLFYIDLARGHYDDALKRLDILEGIESGGAGVELLALLAVLSSGSPSHAPRLHSARDSLVATVAREAFQTSSPRNRTGKLATLGAIHAVLGDSARASATASLLEKVSKDSSEQRRANARASLIRALIARTNGRHEDVVRWTERGLEYRWFGDAIFDPLSAYSITRFIRAEALLASGRNDEADAWFATIGDHDPSDLAFVAQALEQRERIAKARGDLKEAGRHAAQLARLHR